METTATAAPGQPNKKSGLGKYIVIAIALIFMGYLYNRYQGNCKVEEPVKSDTTVVVAPKVDTSGSAMDTTTKVK